MSRAVGNRAEEAAARHLASRGYTILQRNYAIFGAEIDIIAAEGGCVVFVEVRYRALSSPVTPGESVTVAKRKRICRAALCWLQEIGLPEANVRFDIAEVTPGGVTLLRAAFPFTE